MQRNFKIIIVLIGLIFLSTGCSATYYAEITNKSITENINIVETSTKTYQNAYKYTYGNLDDFYESRSYISNYINDRINNYVDNYYINKDNYRRDNKVRQNDMYSSEYRYAIKNESKELQLKNNLFINNVIKDSLIINDNNIILHIDNIPNGLLDEIDDVTVTIYTELTVTSNNADTVENNTYTWNLDKNNYLNKKISLYIERPQAEKNPEDDKKNNNTSNKKDNTAFHIIFIIGLYSVIIIAVVNFFNKKKKLF